jgi:tRNA dimethylallyltransferase
MPPVPEAVRGEARALYQTLGETAFRDRLATVDPQAAARINAGDRQRLTRAFEVWRASGRALSDWQAATSSPLPADSWRGLVLEPPRAELSRRFEARLKAMLAAGALEEVRALAARRLPASAPAMKALGVRPLAAHLAGEITLAEGLALALAQTRRYAKRQLTWLRHQAPDWPRISSERELPDGF